MKRIILINNSQLWSLTAPDSHQDSVLLNLCFCCTVIHREEKEVYKEDNS